MKYNILKNKKTLSLFVFIDAFGVRRQMIWHKSSKKLRETFIYYSSVLLVHT
jgi:hypothetical protein